MPIAADTRTSRTCNVWPLPSVPPDSPKPFLSRPAGPRVRIAWPSKWQCFKLGPGKETLLRAGCQHE